MKKFILISTATASLVYLCGCANDHPAQSTTTTTEETTVQRPAPETTTTETRTVAPGY